jgi:hypothetical protein
MKRGRNWKKTGKVEKPEKTKKFENYETNLWFK